MVIYILPCKSIKHNEYKIQLANIDGECESVPRIINERIQLWESWAVQIKRNNYVDEEDIKTRYTIAREEILKYVQNVAKAFPDPVKIKNIKVNLAKIEHYSIFADSLVFGPYEPTADVIGQVAREEKSKFNTVVDNCIFITKNCTPKISTDSVKASLRKILMKDFKNL